MASHGSHQGIMASGLRGASGTTACGAALPPADVHQRYRHGPATEEGAFVLPLAVPGPLPEAVPFAQHVDELPAQPMSAACARLRLGFPRTTCTPGAFTAPVVAPLLRLPVAYKRPPQLAASASVVPPVQADASLEAQPVSFRLHAPYGIVSQKNAGRQRLRAPRKNKGVPPGAPARPPTAPAASLQWPPPMEPPVVPQPAPSGVSAGQPHCQQAKQAARSGRDGRQHLWLEPHSRRRTWSASNFCAEGRNTEEPQVQLLLVEDAMMAGCPEAGQQARRSSNLAQQFAELASRGQATVSSPSSGAAVPGAASSKQRPSTGSAAAARDRAWLRSLVEGSTAEDAKEEGGAAGSRRQREGQQVHQAAPSRPAVGSELLPPADKALPGPLRNGAAAGGHLWASSADCGCKGEVLSWTSFAASAGLASSDSQQQQVPLPAHAQAAPFAVDYASLALIQYIRANGLASLVEASSSSAPSFPDQPRSFPLLERSPTPSATVFPAAVAALSCPSASSVNWACDRLLHDPPALASQPQRLPAHAVTAVAAVFPPPALCPPSTSSPPTSLVEGPSCRLGSLPSSGPGTWEQWLQCWAARAPLPLPGEAASEGKTEALPGGAQADSPAAKRRKAGGGMQAVRNVSPLEGLLQKCAGESAGVEGEV